MNNLPGIQSNTHVFPEWQYYPMTPITWQFFCIPDFTNDMDKPVGKASPTSIKKLSHDGIDTRAAAIFKHFRAAAILALVMGCIQVSV